MSREVADQYECTEAVVEATPGAAIVANLGVASHFLLAAEDRDRNFYMTGGMGSTTPTGFGVALGTDDQVTVLEGDGSLLMSLGCLATIGRYDPSNFVVVLFNNAVYETTGGQPSLAPQVDFAGMARQCDIEAWHVNDLDAFRDAYDAAVEHDGAAFVAADVESVYPDHMPEPDYYGHSHVKHRFNQALTGD